MVSDARIKQQMVADTTRREESTEKNAEDNFRQYKCTMGPYTDWFNVFLSFEPDGVCYEGRGQHQHQSGSFVSLLSQQYSHQPTPYLGNVL